MGRVRQDDPACSHNNSPGHRMGLVQSKRREQIQKKRALAAMEP